jgi:hypothetical protein
MSVIKHDFAVMSTKTANKDGHKYLGKDGTQAYRVSTKVGNDWYACMIYDEELLPKKGTSYNIELSENEGYKNWAYKLLTKKEQVKQVSQPSEEMPPAIHKEPTDEPDWDEINRGKTRCQVICAIIRAGKLDTWPSYKEDINNIVDFIFTGK